MSSTVQNTVPWSFEQNCFLNNKFIIYNFQVNKQIIVLVIIKLSERSLENNND